MTSTAGTEDLTDTAAIIRAIADLRSELRDLRTVTDDVQARLARLYAVASGTSVDVEQMRTVAESMAEQVAPAIDAISQHPMVRMLTATTQRGHRS
jgi:hypothetical protein